MFKGRYTKDVQLNRGNFKNEEKKLKKHYDEQIILEKNLGHIKRCESHEELCNNPVSLMYGFEELKHEFNGYYSFNLCKKGGVIRLIFSIDKDVMKLEFISMNHYDDFKRKCKKVSENDKNKV